uniref:Kinesin-like protein KIF6/9 C-terminal domain-containing protein n=1 Tax=Cyprinus carpio TaxID=7962 RepID=A0A8C1M3N7_CYPCA
IRETFKILLELSVSQQEAFEVFLRDHEDRLSIENNRAVLQQRSVCATELLLKLILLFNEMFNCPIWDTWVNIFVPTTFCQSVAGNLMPSESDSVEERILNQIEEEKKHYKIKSGCLKGLKTEIEHLQLLHEKLKVKLQKDFENWWTQEGARLKVLFLYNMHNIALPPAECSSTSIPLTGDKQTDDDIEAFIRTRHNLLHKRALLPSMLTHTRNLF